jgi:homoserine dehydrogenase
MSSVNIGIVGCGTVGTEVCDLLLRSPALLENRIGVGVNIVKVAVRTLAKSRKCNLHLQTLTTSWEEVVSHPDVQLVVELIGGITVAREVVTAALKRGLPVVTANKALISAHGKDLIAHAEKNQANIYFEASVAGGIPIIKALREGMIANQIEYLYGILNGTCNYILTEMTQAGIGLDKALDQATKNGFAEADPSLDVEGMDSAHKIGILASLAHGFWIRPEEVHVEGIAHLRRDEMGEMLRNKRDHVILADGINHLDIKYVACSNEKLWTQWR